MKKLKRKKWCQCLLMLRRFGSSVRSLFLVVTLKSFRLALGRIVPMQVGSLTLDY